jgi:hypothetical protein
VIHIMQKSQMEYQLNSKRYFAMVDIAVATGASSLSCLASLY